MSSPPSPRMSVISRPVVLNLDSPVFCSLGGRQPREAHLDLDGCKATIRPDVTCMFVFRSWPRLVFVRGFAHGFVLRFVLRFVLGRRDQPRQGSVEGGEGCGGYFVEGQWIRHVIVIAQI